MEERQYLYIYTLTCGMCSLRPHIKSLVGLYSGMNDRFMFMYICTGILHLYNPQVRNDDLKQHPLLCPLTSLSHEDRQYDYSMAHETLATLLALGYQIQSPDSRRLGLEYHELDPQQYHQSNGYLPRPLKLDSVEVEERLQRLVARLAENCHNVWAALRIKQGWTYGKSNVSHRAQQVNIHVYTCNVYYTYSYM